MKRLPVAPRRKVRLILYIILVFVLSIAGFLRLQDYLNSRSEVAFVEAATQTTQNIVRDAQAYNAVLYSARSYLSSSEFVTENEWREFISGMGTFAQNPGMSSVYVINPVDTAQLESFIATAKQNNTIADDFIFKPTAAIDTHGVATVNASNNDIKSVIGFDFFSTETRRATYATALSTNQPTASEPLLLASGKYGLFVTLPVMNPDGTLRFYVSASLRSEDFVAHLIDSRSQGTDITITDITDPMRPIALLASETTVNRNARYTRDDQIDFGNRRWQVTYRSDATSEQTTLSRFSPYFILATGLIIIWTTLIAYGRKR